MEEKKVNISEEQIDQAVETALTETDEEGSVTVNFGCGASA
jgi:hypothetical protein